MSVTKVIRMEEVKKNADADSLWIVINNSVYDVTDYLNEHPGGVDVLMEEAGSDATKAFEDVGHSSDAREMLAKYKIGELHEDDVVPSKSCEQKWKLSCLIIAVLGLTITAISVYKYRLSK